MPSNNNSLELFYNDELFSREDEFINNDPWALAQREGITILSDKDFLCGHVADTDEGKLIVSAVFDAFDNSNNAYSFDTVVDHRYQRQGLGTELIDIAMRKFKNEILDADPEAILDLDVVNEHMVDFLTKKYGLSIKQIQGGHTLMGKRMRVEASTLNAQDQSAYSYSIVDKETGEVILQVESRSAVKDFQNNINEDNIKKDLEVYENDRFVARKRKNERLFNWYKLPIKGKIAQTTQNRKPQEEETAYLDQAVELPTRSHKIAEIQQAALAFAADFLIDYDLPSSPMLHIGNTHGFEDSKKAFIESTAVNHVLAEFTTTGQHTIRIDFAIPYYKGELQKPSIVSYQDKRYIFSQDFLTDIIANHETNRPNMNKPMTPNYLVERRENIVQPLFGAPKDPSGWSDLLTERY